MKKEIEIYQVGDKVFDAQFGWGQIKEILKNINFCIKVTFISGKIEEYTQEGFYVLEDLKPSLSFTEYDFVNGGFSQNRKDINKYLIGKLGWFWDNDDVLDGTESICFGILNKVNCGKFYTSEIKWSVGVDYDNFSLECPIKL